MHTAKSFSTSELFTGWVKYVYLMWENVNWLGLLALIALWGVLVYNPAEAVLAGLLTIVASALILAATGNYVYSFERATSTFKSFIALVWGSFLGLSGLMTLALVFMIAFDLGSTSENVGVWTTLFIIVLIFLLMMINESFYTSKIYPTICQAMYDGLESGLLPAHRQLPQVQSELKYLRDILSNRTPEKFQDEIRTREKWFAQLYYRDQLVARIQQHHADDPNADRMLRRLDWPLLSGLDEHITRYTNYLDVKEGRY